MKLLFESWRRYLKEEEEYSITPEQNQALKEMYILISRSVYEHLNQWAQEKGYDPADYSFKAKMKKEYKPAPGITKDKYKLRFDVSKFQKVFPDLSDDFYIHFLMNPAADGSNAELARVGNEITDLSLALKNFSNSSAVKRSIQHELQHIIDWGSSGGEGAEGVINYLSDLGEVRAHAKEAAYYFHKTFPEENQLDIEKIKKGVSNSYTNYYNFATKASDIVQRKNLDPSYEQKMKTAGERFIKYATYYLTLFKRKEYETHI